MDQPDLVLAEAQLSPSPLLGRGGVALLALLDQRADPIGLAAAPGADRARRYVASRSSLITRVSTGVRPGGTRRSG